MLLAIGPLISGATLTGRVVADHGRPVNNALIAVQPTVLGPSGITIYRTTTEAQGRFSLDVPAPGTYTVCVDATQQGLLNNCQWFPNQSTVQIASGQTSPKMDVTLVTGIMLSIRLDDPDKLLPPPGQISTSTTAPIVSFGVWDTDGNYHQAVSPSSDNNGRDFQLLLPPGQSLKLSVQAINARVLDQTNTQVSSAPSVSLSTSPSVLAQIKHYRLVAPLVLTGPAPAVPATPGVSK